MTSTGSRYLIIHAALLLGMLLIAWFTHAWLLCLGLYLGLVIGWHSRHLLALSDWLADTSKPLPAAWDFTGSGGIWSKVFAQLSKQHKRQQKAQRKLRRAVEEYRNATESFPEPIITLNDHGNVVWCNSAACEHIGLRKPDDIDQPVGNILRDPAFVEWMETDGLQPLDIISPKDDNIKLNVRIFTLSQRRRLLLFRDVTELRNVETVRRDFVANVSHELRTPLTVLIGYLESLSEDGGPELRLITERMYEQTSQMRILIDDLIEISRLQSQVVHGRETEVNISALMAQLREQADSLNNKQHKIRFINDAPFNITGIESDLESAFSNLITNAIRYTPEGGTIDITWSAVNSADDGTNGSGDDHNAIFSVRDNGVGIPHADIPRLTERFYRVAKDRARSSGGSGLGLSIVKHVLNAHDAHLDINSELGSGSEFRCIFPADRLVAVNQQPSISNQTHSSGSQRRLA